MLKVFMCLIDCEGKIGQHTTFSIIVKGKKNFSIMFCLTKYMMYLSFFFSTRQIKNGNDKENLFFDALKLMLKKT